MQDSWTMEPELAEHPPRRVVSSDQKNPNQPNAMVLYGAAGAAVLLGVILLVVGLSGSNLLLGLLGGALALGGAGLAFWVPQQTAKYFARAEHLATHGIPVMARVLASDNMGGENQYMRLVRYQVTMPGGDLINKQVYADDRRLPVQIPGNATALVDIDNNDVELYCALPFVVVAKPGAAPRPTGDPLAELIGAPTGATATPTPAAPTSMNTLNVEPMRPVRPKKGETPSVPTASPPTAPPTVAPLPADVAGATAPAAQPTDLESVLGMDMVQPATQPQALPQLNTGPAPLARPSADALEVAPVAAEVAPLEPVTPAADADPQPADEPKDEAPAEPATPAPKPAKPSSSGLPWE